MHELGHLGEPRSTLAGLCALNLLPRLPFLFTVPAMARFGPGSCLAIACLSCLLSYLLLRARRRMELRADRAAVASADPLAYARALETIHRVNQAPAVMGGRIRRTHPDLYDRMIAAGVTPDYPRPAKPKRFHWSSAVLLAMVAAEVVLVIRFC